MEWYYLLVIPVYLFIDSVVSYYRLNNIYHKYILWVTTTTKVNILGEKSALKSLIRHAGVEDSIFPDAQLIGYGQVATYRCSVLDNFPSNRQDMAAHTSRMIEEALGVYRDRMWNAFNPLSWIHALIFLPTTVISYLGIGVKNIFAKTLQFIWWFIAVSISVIQFTYPNFTRHFLDAILQGLIR